MRRYLGKIGAICLVLTLCLAAIGVAYGHWTETLNIEGVAETGDMDVGFLNAIASDNEEPPIDDWGETSVTLHNYDGDSDYEWMQVNLVDGYYCYVGIVNFDVHNNGTIPVAVSAIIITEPAGGEIEVALSGIAVGDVIDPNQSIPCILTAHIVDQDGSGDGSFSVHIEVVNWNEV
jgi:hypothetical protein